MFSGIGLVSASYILATHPSVVSGKAAGRRARVLLGKSKDHPLYGWDNEFGRQETRDSRYAFRRQFFQHAGLRYVQSEQPFTMTFGQSRNKGSDHDMPAANSVFKLCRPRPEVLAGELPDAIFAADLWEVVTGKAHPDYQDPKKFFAGIRTFTPWGQIALMAGGIAGYERVRENDEKGICPDRSEFANALGDGPVLILIDELVLYMARAFALDADSPRARVNSQWATFFQVLFSLAANRPQTVVLLTVPSEQDANRVFTGDLKSAISDALALIEGADRTTGRHARNVTPTQAQERGAVLAKR